MVFLPILFKASASPMMIVDFPSPAGVGLIAVTRINLPTGLLSTSRILSKLSLALYFRTIPNHRKRCQVSRQHQRLVLIRYFVQFQYLFFIQNSSTSNVLIHYIIK